MKLSLIILDFDGVIIESEREGFKLLAKVLGENHDIQIPQNLFTEKVGITTLSFLQKFFGDKLTGHEIESIYEVFKEEFSENLTKYVKPHNQTILFVKENRHDYILAVASMNTKKFTGQALEHYGIEKKIDLVVSREEVRHHKPDPEIYFKTLRKIDCKPEAALVFEDSPAGVKAANNAKIGCVVVLNGLNGKEDFNQVSVVDYVEVDNFRVNKTGKILSNFNTFTK